VIGIAISKVMKDVVGAIIERGGMILLAQRSCATLNRKWEFPGGKVEPGETQQAALQREIFEELGVEILVGDKIGANQFEISGKRYRLHVYWATILKGEPVAREHYSIAWVRPNEMLSYDFAPADVPIVEEVMKDDR